MSDSKESIIGSVDGPDNQSNELNNSICIAVSNSSSDDKNRMDKYNIQKNFGFENMFAQNNFVEGTIYSDDEPNIDLKENNQSQKKKIAIFKKKLSGIFESLFENQDTSSITDTEAFKFDDDFKEKTVGFFDVKSKPKSKKNKIK
jgi:hypothetical protein